mmetsp:Transcript_79056/g.229597  ORF Transcript_79056/g.229597 Transcript_79056/m.229597 type:complete len:258 (-) Transcript_79056:228-1001(-)
MWQVGAPRPAAAHAAQGVCAVARTMQENALPVATCGSILRVSPDSKTSPAPSKATSQVLVASSSGGAAAAAPRSIYSAGPIVIPGCGGLQQQRKRPAEHDIVYDDDRHAAVPQRSHTGVWAGVVGAQPQGVVGSDGDDRDTDLEETMSEVTSDEEASHSASDEDADKENRPPPPDAALRAPFFCRIVPELPRVEVAEAMAVDEAAPEEKELPDENAGDKADCVDPDFDFCSEGWAQHLERRIRDNVDGMYDFEIWVE